MATYDLGDPVALGVSITDAAGAAANASTVVLTITLPDGTTTTPTVTNPATGSYTASYAPSIAGRFAVRWVATGTNASAYTDEFTVRDPNLLGIVSYDEVLAHLNIPAASAPEEELRRFIDAATNECERITGVVLGRRSETDTFDGGETYVRLFSPYAMSITSVTENGITLPATSYRLDATGQRLYRIGSNVLLNTNTYGVWAPGAANIVVTYVAGFANPPASAKQAVLEMIRHLWQTQRGAMNVMTRNQTGDDFYNSSSFSVPRRVQELLDPISLPSIA